MRLFGPPKEFRDVAPIADFGHKLLAAFPDVRFCGVGNAPSWIVEAMMVEAALGGRTLDATCAPFSGSLCKVVDPQLYFRQHSVPSPAQTRWYHALLTRQGVAPEQIVDAFETKHQKTLFFDSIHSGLSLASFLAVFYTLAKAKGLAARTQDATEILAIVSPLNDKTVENGHIFIENILSHPLKVMWDTNEMSPLLSRLELHEKRLTPACPLTNWQGEPPVLDRTAHGIPEVRARLTRYIEQTYLHPAPLLGWLRFARKARKDCTP